MSYTITPGFTGGITVAGSSKWLRFTSCGINAIQTVEAPDMVMGDYTHNAWAYGKIEVGGQISGPLDENGLDVIKLINGSNLLTVRYYSGVTKVFSGCSINTLTFNITAGEVVNFTCDVMGTTVASGTDSTVTEGTKTAKLLTWDKAALYVGSITTVTPATNLIAGLQSFTVTISRNLSRQFVISSSSLFGNLVGGMHGLTGQMVAYGVGHAQGGGADYWNQYANNAFYPIKFDLGTLSVTGTVAFHRATTELGIGPILSTIGFTGIGNSGGGTF